MLTIRWLREQMRQGKSIFDLPLRVTPSYIIDNFCSSVYIFVSTNQPPLYHSFCLPFIFYIYLNHLFQ